MPTKYRSKAVSCTAIKYTGDNFVEVNNFIPESDRRVGIYVAHDGLYLMNFHKDKVAYTLIQFNNGFNQLASVAPGAYVIRCNSGKFISMSGDMFELVFTPEVE